MKPVVGKVNRTKTLPIYCHWPYIGVMYRWRISLFGKTPARYLGTVMARDQAAAVSAGIELFGIAETLRFRVVAERIVEAPTRAPTKAAMKQKARPR